MSAPNSPSRGSGSSLESLRGLLHRISSAPHPKALELALMDLSNFILSRRHDMAVNSLYQELFHVLDQFMSSEAITPNSRTYCIGIYSCYAVIISSNDGVFAKFLEYCSQTLMNPDINPHRAMNFLYALHGFLVQMENVAEFRHLPDVLVRICTALTNGAPNVSMSIITPVLKIVDVVADAWVKSDVVDIAQQFIDGLLAWCACDDRCVGNITEKFSTSFSQFFKANPSIADQLSRAALDDARALLGLANSGLSRNRSQLSDSWGALISIGKAARAPFTMKMAQIRALIRQTRRNRGDPGGYPMEIETVILLRACDGIMRAFIGIHSAVHGRVIQDNLLSLLFDVFKGLRSVVHAGCHWYQCSRSVASVPVEQMLVMHAIEHTIISVSSFCNSQLETPLHSLRQALDLAVDLSYVWGCELGCDPLAVTAPWYQRMLRMLFERLQTSGATISNIVHVLDRFALLMHNARECTCGQLFTRITLDALADLVKRELTRDNSLLVGTLLASSIVNCIWYSVCTSQGPGRIRSSMVDAFNDQLRKTMARTSDSGVWKLAGLYGAGISTELTDSRTEALLPVFRRTRSRSYHRRPYAYDTDEDDSLLSSVTKIFEALEAALRLAAVDIESVEDCPSVVQCKMTPSESGIRLWFDSSKSLRRSLIHAAVRPVLVETYCSYCWDGSCSGFVSSLRSIAQLLGGLKCTDDKTTAEYYRCVDTVAKYSVSLCEAFPEGRSSESAMELVESIQRHVPFHTSSDWLKLLNAVTEMIEQVLDSPVVRLRAVRAGCLCVERWQKLLEAGLVPEDVGPVMVKLAHRLMDDETLEPVASVAIFKFLQKCNSSLLSPRNRLPFDWEWMEKVPSVILRSGDVLTAVRRYFFAWLESERSDNEAVAKRRKQFYDELVTILSRARVSGLTENMDSLVSILCARFVVQQKLRIGEWSPNEFFQCLQQVANNLDTALTVAMSKMLRAARSSSEKENMPWADWSSASLRSQRFLEFMFCFDQLLATIPGAPVFHSDVTDVDPGSSAGSSGEASALERFYASNERVCTDYMAVLEPALLNLAVKVSTDGGYLYRWGMSRCMRAQRKLMSCVSTAQGARGDSERRLQTLLDTQVSTLRFIVQILRVVTVFKCTSDHGWTDLSVLFDLLIRTHRRVLDSWSGVDEGVLYETNMRLSEWSVLLSRAMHVLLELCAESTVDVHPITLSQTLLKVLLSALSDTFDRVPSSGQSLPRILQTVVFILSTVSWLVQSLTEFTTCEREDEDTNVDITTLQSLQRRVLETAHNRCKDCANEPFAPDMQKLQVFVRMYVSKMSLHSGLDADRSSAGSSAMATLPSNVSVDIVDMLCTSGDVSALEKVRCLKMFAPTFSTPLPSSLGNCYIQRLEAQISSDPSSSPDILSQGSNPLRGKPSIHVQLLRDIESVSEAVRQGGVSERRAKFLLNKSVGTWKAIGEKTHWLSEEHREESAALLLCGMELSDTIRSISSPMSQLESVFSEMSIGRDTVSELLASPQKVTEVLASTVTSEPPLNPSVHLSYARMLSKDSSAVSNGSVVDRCNAWIGVAAVAVDGCDVVEVAVELVNVIRSSEVAAKYMHSQLDNVPRIVWKAGLSLIIPALQDCFTQHADCTERVKVLQSILERLLEIDDEIMHSSLFVILQAFPNIVERQQAEAYSFGKAYKFCQSLLMLSVLPRERWVYFVSSAKRYVDRYLRLFEVEVSNALMNGEASESANDTLDGLLETYSILTKKIVSGLKFLLSNPYGNVGVDQAAHTERVERFREQYTWRLEYAVSMFALDPDMLREHGISGESRAFRSLVQCARTGWKRIVKLTDEMEADHQQSKRPMMLSYVVQNPLAIVDISTVDASINTTLRDGPPLLLPHCLTFGARLSSIRDERFIQVTGIQPEIPVLHSKTRPKRVTFDAADGNSYAYLLKGKEEVALDYRVHEFNKFANEFLNRSAPHGSVRSTSFIQARSLTVIPLSTWAGLIQWYDDVTPLLCMYEKWLKHRSKLDPSKPVTRPMTLYKSTLLAALREKGETDPDRLAQLASNQMAVPQDVRKKVYEVLHRSTAQNLISRELLSMSTTAQHWRHVQSAFVESLASASIMGYVLGLGDRHLENLLFSSENGTVAMIDFNVIFGKGSHLSVPECVPFRLTQTMVDAIGPGGVEGSFRLRCEQVMKVLRTRRGLLTSFLQSFIDDPIDEWKRLRVKSGRTGSQDAPSQSSVPETSRKSRADVISGLNMRFHSSMAQAQVRKVSKFVAALKSEVALTGLLSKCFEAIDTVEHAKRLKEQAEQQPSSIQEEIVECEREFHAVTEYLTSTSKGIMHEFVGVLHDLNAKLEWISGQVLGVALANLPNERAKISNDVEEGILELICSAMDSLSPTGSVMTKLDVFVAVEIRGIVDPLLGMLRRYISIQSLLPQRLLVLHADGSVRPGHPFVHSDAQFCRDVDGPNVPKDSEAVIAHFEEALAGFSQRGESVTEEQTRQSFYSLLQIKQPWSHTMYHYHIKEAESWLYGAMDRVRLRRSTVRRHPTNTAVGFLTELYRIGMHPQGMQTVWRMHIFGICLRALLEAQHLFESGQQHMERDAGKTGFIDTVVALDRLQHFHQCVARASSVIDFESHAMTNEGYAPVRVFPLSDSNTPVHIGFVRSRLETVNCVLRRTHSTFSGITACGSKLLAICNLQAYLDGVTSGGKEAASLPSTYYPAEFEVIAGALRKIRSDMQSGWKSYCKRSFPTASDEQLATVFDRVMDDRGAVPDGDIFAEAAGAVTDPEDRSFARVVVRNKKLDTIREAAQRLKSEWDVAISSGSLRGVVSALLSTVNSHTLPEPMSPLFAELRVLVLTMVGDRMQFAQMVLDVLTIEAGHTKPERVVHALSTMYRYMDSTLEFLATIATLFTSLAERYTLHTSGCDFYSNELPSVSDVGTESVVVRLSKASPSCAIVDTFESLTASFVDDAHRVVFGCVHDLFDSTISAVATSLWPVASRVLIQSDASSDVDVGDWDIPSVVSSIYTRKYASLLVENVDKQLDVLNTGYFGHSLPDVLESLHDADDVPDTRVWDIHVQTERILLGECQVNELMELSRVSAMCGEVACGNASFLEAAHSATNFEWRLALCAVTDYRELSSGVHSDISRIVTDLLTSRERLEREQMRMKETARQKGMPTPPAVEELFRTCRTISRFIEDIVTVELYFQRNARFGIEDDIISAVHETVTRLSSRKLLLTKLEELNAKRERHEALMSDRYIEDVTGSATSGISEMIEVAKPLLGRFVASIDTVEKSAVGAADHVERAVAALKKADVDEDISGTLSACTESVQQLRQISDGLADIGGTHKTSCTVSLPDRLTSNLFDVPVLRCARDVVSFSEQWYDPVSDISSHLERMGEIIVDVSLIKRDVEQSDNEATGSDDNGAADDDQFFEETNPNEKTVLSNVQSPPKPRLRPEPDRTLKSTPTIRDGGQKDADSFVVHPLSNAGLGSKQGKADLHACRRFAQNAVEIVGRKLMGQDTDLSPDKALTVEEHVRALIAEATSSSNLVRMYAGWTPWV